MKKIAVSHQLGMAFARPDFDTAVELQSPFEYSCTQTHHASMAASMCLKTKEGSHLNRDKTLKNDELVEAAITVSHNVIYLEERSLFFHHSRSHL